MISPTTEYTRCLYCDHFVDAELDDDGETIFVHLEDGEQEFDHDGVPSKVMTLAEWKTQMPDLFKEYPDGKIGPNSIYHSRRGKID